MSGAVYAIPSPEDRVFGTRLLRFRLAGQIQRRYMSKVRQSMSDYSVGMKADRGGRTGGFKPQLKQNLRVRFWPKSDPFEVAREG